MRSASTWTAHSARHSTRSCLSPHIAHMVRSLSESELRMRVVSVSVGLLLKNRFDSLCGVTLRHLRRDVALIEIET